MTTITAKKLDTLNNLKRSIDRSIEFDSHLMFNAIDHAHLLGLNRLKYLYTMLNKALDKCDAKDARDPWHYHPEREFYSLSLSVVKQYLKITENVKEIQRLVKLENYEVAQQLFEETEQLKLEAKKYIAKNK